MTASKAKTPKSKNAKSKALRDLPVFVASCASRLSGQSPTLGNLQSLFQMFTVEFGHHESLESKTIYTENGAARLVHKEWWWKLPGNQSLSLHYGPAGIQVLHGFAENPNTNTVLLHFTQAEKKKKVNPRLLTTTRFDNLFECVSTASAQDASAEQRYAVQNMLALMLGKPQNEGESPTKGGFMDWRVGNAELTLFWQDDGMTLALADLSA